MPQWDIWDWEGEDPFAPEAGLVVLYRNATRALCSFVVHVLDYCGQRGGRQRRRRGHYIILLCVLNSYPAIGVDLLQIYIELA